MAWHEDLYGHLKRHTALTALIGTRVYPDDPPPNPTLPMITYLRATFGAQHTMGGGSNLIVPEIQIDVYGTDRLEARNVTAEVMDAMSNFRGTLNALRLKLVDGAFLKLTAGGFVELGVQTGGGSTVVGSTLRQGYTEVHELAAEWWRTILRFDMSFHED
tara:strand:+ start:458 stop:937 length:480 start_codon:yes stop_codon:yes gene_type:complete